jgi:hypothetical protein
MKETVTRIYRECRTGAEFAARLTKYGLQLVAGDRTDFCVLDAAGHLHSLARRLDGVTTAALRDFLRDIPLS